MPIPKPESRLRYRIETLVGITGARMSKYRDTWAQAIFPIFNVVWRPHLLSILVFEGLLFGFGIGINVGSCLVIIVRTESQIASQVTNAVFLGIPKPEGYGFDQFAIAGAYGTPIVRSSIHGDTKYFY